MGQWWMGPRDFWHICRVERPYPWALLHWNQPSSARQPWYVRLQHPNERTVCESTTMTTQDKDHTNQWFFHLFQRFFDLRGVKFRMVRFEFFQNNFQSSDTFEYDFVGFFFRSKVHLLIQERKNYRLLCKKKIRKEIHYFEQPTSLSWWPIIEVVHAKQYPIKLSKSLMIVSSVRCVSMELKPSFKVWCAYVEYEMSALLMLVHAPLTSNHVVM